MNQKNILIRSKIINELKKYWLIELNIKKNVFPKRYLRLNILNIKNLDKKHITIKYYIYGFIPRLIKIKYFDITICNGKLKRKKI